MPHKENVPSIYDSVDIQFVWSQFSTQFLVHILCPLFLWLSPNLEAQGFLDPGAGLFFNYITHFMFATMVIIVIISPTYINGNGSSVYTPMVFYLTQRLMVALKYGSLSESEYNRFMSCKDRNTQLGKLCMIFSIAGVCDFSFNL